jgi:copper chaperone
MRERFSVPEVSCAHCKSSIEGALEPLDGVAHALVSIDTKQVEVDWDPSCTSREDVVGAIRSAGYEVSD